ncbi:MAG: o-succinylbenzoate synthase [Synoicihabitans sp.]
MSDRYSFHPYHLPFRAPLRTAHGLWAEREGWWVKRVNENGDPVWGEIAPIPGFGTTGYDGVQSVLNELGQNPPESALQQVLNRGGEAAFGIGASRWDWQAGLAAGPDYLPVAGLLPAGRAVFPALDARAQMGFRTFKWKVGVSDAREEIPMLDDVLARLPSGARLRLDANGAWDRRAAERWLAVCAERPEIDYVEQPAPRDQQDLLLGLSGDYPVTLALDESICGKHDFNFWTEAGWNGVFVIKPVLWGDPLDLVETLSGTESDVVISSGLESVVGARVVLAIAFALGDSKRALGTGVWPLFEPDGFEGPHIAPFVRKSEILNLDVKRVEQKVFAA